MRFLENGENVVFLGPPGVGKTHLASALGLVAAKHRFSTYYINCHQLIEQLKKAHFENRLPDRLKILSKYRMLILRHSGPYPASLHRGQHQRRVIQAERTQGIYAPEAADCEHTI